MPASVRLADVRSEPAAGSGSSIANKSGRIFIVPDTPLDPAKFDVSDRARFAVGEKVDVLRGVTMTVEWV
jgi:hypothetical protein